MEELKSGLVKTWKIVATIFAVLAGLVVYLVTKNKSLLVKIMQGETEKKDAVLEEKKKQLEDADQQLKNQQEYDEMLREAAKKSMTPEEVEKHWNKK